MGQSSHAHRLLPSEVRVTHPFPLTLVVVTSAMLTFIARGGIPPATILARVVAVVLCSQIAVGALNDYVDRERDALYQPDKPIPSGAISAHRALLMAVLCVPAGLAVAATLGKASLVIAAIGFAFSLAYDIWLKPTPMSLFGYIGGFLSLITWIWLVAGNLGLRFFLLYPAGAALVTAAHLAQSLPDVETDRKMGLRGLAAILGPRPSFRLMLLLAALLAAFAAVLSAYERSLPSALLTAASLPLILAAWLVGRGPLTRGRSVLVFRLLLPAVALLGIALLASRAWA